MKNYKREIIKKLKKEKNKNLPGLISRWIDESESAYPCTDCARCCRELGPLIKHSEINTICALMNKKKDFILEKIIELDEDNDWVFRKIPCPFNDNNKHCSIYDWRFDSCRKYPEADRFLNSPGNILIKDSEYCPQLDHIFKKLKFYFNL